MVGGLWHYTGGSDENHPQEKEIQKGKMVVWGGLANSWEKKRGKRQMRKGKTYPSEYRVTKNSKERLKRKAILIEHWRIHAFELWCWRRLLRVPWTARRSNQSILKEISPEYSLKGLMFKLKLQYFGHLIWRVDSFKKTLMLGKIEGRRRRGQQRMSWLDGVT